MPFGAALTFDPQTDAALRSLWQAQAEAGLPSFLQTTDIPPHLTLMMAEDLPVDRLRDALVPLAAAWEPLPIEFLSLGIFPARFGVVFLAPVVTSALLDLHASFWQAAAPLAVRPGDHYRPGVWVPHATLAFDLPPDQLGPATAFLAEQPWPVNATITGIVIGMFTIKGESCFESIPLGR